MTESYCIVDKRVLNSIVDAQFVETKKLNT